MQLVDQEESWGATCEYAYADSADSLGLLREAQEENTRLREALTDILGWAKSERVMKHNLADSEMAERLFKKARAALEQGEKV